jgi:ribonuclease P protein component
MPPADKKSDETRLKKKEQFDHVLQANLKASDQHLLIYAQRNEQASLRFGLIVSRKVGSAVKRNRYKRLLRECFRLHSHEYPAGIDLVLIPRAVPTPSLQNYAASLKYLTWKLQRKLETP